jgi:hypothetical protein
MGPRILSVGPPPERHAARVVAEMCHWLVDERQRLSLAMREALAASRSRLGSPKAQIRFVHRMRKAGGKALVDLQLTPGKQARFELIWVTWSVMGPDDRDLRPGEPMPDKPLLSLDTACMTKKDIDFRQVFVLTHHAMQRLAECGQLRNADDLLGAVADLWRAINANWEAIGFAKDVGRITRLPVHGGTAILERVAGGRLIVKTVLRPGMDIATPGRT